MVKGELEKLQALLDQFEKRFHVHVRLEVYPTWALGWSRLVENALYRSGPDISEVGNSWIGDLARMDSLHPFTNDEIINITKDARLLGNIWSTRIKGGDTEGIAFSIPWTGDTRAVFYRRDIFEKTGIDENDAFIDAIHFDRTLSSLEGKGISMPMSLTTQRSSLTIHYVASWIWGAGGDFLSPDGTKLTFNQPEAMEGCKAYFRQGRYLGGEGRNLDEEGSNSAFRTGKAAITLNGYWMLDLNQMSPDVKENLGVASMPGIPFVGGQDLAIWNHSRHIPAVIKLIQYLHSEEAGKEFYPAFGLPISENAWENPPFDTGFYQIFKTAIRKGRGFHGGMWGLVEKRLTDEYADIWANVLKSPVAQLDEIVENRLNNLARRLQLSIGSQD